MSDMFSVEEEKDHDERIQELTAMQFPLVTRNQRRAVRAPCVVDAQMEVVGVTLRMLPFRVRTRDVNQWGVRVDSSRRLAAERQIVLTLAEPSGILLVVDGRVVHVQQFPD
jgi:hypothetical protein